MLIKNKGKIGSKLFIWDSPFIKNIKKKKKKFIIKSSLSILILPPLILGLKPLGFKLFNLLPEQHQNEIKGIIADTYIDEISNSEWKSPIQSWPTNFLKGTFSKADNLYIDITYKNFQKILREREKALLKGKLIQDDDSSQKAFLTFKNKKYPAQIRLKGDLTDHFKGTNQWSFRVRLLNDKTIYGMKKFSLHVPKTRNYLGDSIYHRFLKYENLPSLRNKVIQLNLNGKHLGTYTIEEHFDKYLIENNKLREGIIIGLNESSWWNGQSESYLKNQISLNEDYFKNWPTRTFDRKRIKNNSNLQDQYIFASNLLNQYLKGNLVASKVFETDKTAKFLAINDLLGAQHGLYWTNLRFLYNPFTKKLIPIGFDANATGRISSLVNHTGSLSLIFKDQEIQKRYLFHLNRISNEKYLRKFLEIHKKDIKKEISMLHKTYPWTYRFKDYLQNIRFNQLFIQSELNPEYDLLNANLNKFSNQTSQIDITNRSYLPIKIIGISFKNNLIFEPSEELILPSFVSEKKPGNMYKFSSLLKGKDKFPSENKYDDLKIRYKVLGLSSIREEKINTFLLNKNIKSNLKSITNIDPNAEDFNFLDVDNIQKIIKFKPGLWIIKKPLILPEGYKLVADHKVNITLTNEGLILSRGAIEFIGNPKSPIQVSAKNNGMGIVVLNAKDQSRLNYVKFSNLYFPYEKGLNITGSINFYESPVQIIKCEFDANFAEDFLNIFRSKFEIKDSIFSNTKSDALDIDFGQGSMLNVEFFNIGNDAIDISGTYLEGKNISINGSGDKAISVGEKSTMILENLSISNSAIGIASKDLSVFRANNVNVNSTKLGFTAFQKKDEYGPGSIIIKNLNENNWSGDESVKKLKFYLLEPSSVININGYSFKYNVDKVKDFLYGNTYGKSSK